MLADYEDQAHLVEAIDTVTRSLGGLTRRRRFDRMATVCDPASGRLTASFSAVAKYYAVAVDICPPRRGNRKGVVEKANHSAAQRWWRTLPDDVDVPAAQAGLDALCVRLDERCRMRDGQRTTVGALAAGEGLRACPAAPSPAELEVTATVTAQGLVPFRGNSYSVPPGMRGARITVRHRLGAGVLRLATVSGAVVAVHQRGYLRSTLIRRSCSCGSSRPRGIVGRSACSRISASAALTAAIRPPSRSRSHATRF
ncbi:hypothetical protein [Catellatospora sp. NPDC049609]|uniref:Mu transposase domain-containing protein n=1 Tax=Catellatospora sp. NPDC049609 TaxID=3155505 RepID=UPI003440ACB3